jgi:hypothetical protein
VYPLNSHIRFVAASAGRTKKYRPVFHCEKDSADVEA